ncbi:PPE family protein [Mycobacterium sp.]|uniref:PPE family protein n=1 Tax=Mycobacterium sp. TaxID=1785 RepID=UPI003BAD7FB9
MIDFGALPPEVNSARMYCGPGSGPMMAAAAAWRAVAAQLEFYASGYSSVLAQLQGQSWSGAASIAMVSAATPYIAWATTSAERADHVASQAQAAAAAYEIAFAATVPPEVVASNRIRLAILIATNFFGQNGPAIGATETEYTEMWAQNAAAMYTYAAASSAATKMSLFDRPPQTTNMAGQSTHEAAAVQSVSNSVQHNQALASQLMSALTQQLQTLANAGLAGGSAPSGSNSPWTSMLLAMVAGFNTLTGPLNFLGQISRTMSSATSGGLGVYRTSLQAPPVGVRPVATKPNSPGWGAVRGRVVASVGKAVPVGKLFVPQSWTADYSTIDQADGPRPMAGADIRLLSATRANPSAHTVDGLPATSSGGQSEGPLVLRNGRRRFTMPRPCSGG